MRYIKTLAIGEQKRKVNYRRKDHDKKRSTENGLVTFKTAIEIRSNQKSFSDKISLGLTSKTSHNMAKVSNAGSLSPRT